MLDLEFKLSGVFPMLMSLPSCKGLWKCWCMWIVCIKFKPGDLVMAKWSMKGTIIIQVWHCVLFVLNCEQELEDLFSRLDTDGDGRIAFAEVHEGLFQHGLSSGQTEMTTSQEPPSLPQSSSPKRLSSLPGRLSGLDDSLRSQSSSLTGTPSGIFSALDTEKTGWGKQQE